MGTLTCTVCNTVTIDDRLKPAHDGGRTKVTCPKCSETTEHLVRVERPPDTSRLSSAPKR